MRNFSRANKNNFFGFSGLASETEAGFSLLEVLIAIFIIITALIAVLTLLSQTTAAGAASASKLIAANLAQEGIEVVKNIRDFRTDESGWNNWYASLSGANDYLVQYSDVNLRPFQDIPLNYDVSTGRYGYDFGSPASFSYKRRITLQKISDVEIKIVVQVTWTAQGLSRSLTVEDRLWNWR